MRFGGPKEEPKVCEECQKKLTDGDRYFEDDGWIFCRDCYIQWKPEDWLDFMNLKEKVY